MTRVCEICWSRPAKYRCPICGRYVCERHFVKSYGMCTICFETTCSVCHRRPAVSTCSICGRPVCHGCSIDIDGVRRVCFNCIIGGRYKKYLKEIRRATRGSRSVASVGMR